MPEDTKGLKTGVLTRDEFLAQARIAGDENQPQFRHVLDGFRDGLLFYYFGNVDQVSHMMWRARDPGASRVRCRERRALRARHRGSLRRASTRSSARRGATLGPDDLLVVMSDHGFTSWRRSFHLNSWLRDNGYLAVRNPNLREDPGLFGNVDWSQTRAYALGLNGLYINVKGRERIRHRRARPIARRWRARSRRSCWRRSIRRPASRRSPRCFGAKQVVPSARHRGHRAGPDRRLREGHARLGRIGARRPAARGHRDNTDRVERRPLHGSRRGAGHAAREPRAVEAGAAICRRSPRRSSPSSASQEFPASRRPGENDPCSDLESSWIRRCSPR